MMKKLLSHVRVDIDTELYEARMNNGMFFNSSHEGYGVIAEEHDEAREEAEEVALALKAMLQAIRKNDSRELLQTVNDLGAHATLAACEYIQVAAMAKKMRESLWGKGGGEKR